MWYLVGLAIFIFVFTEVTGRIYKAVTKNVPLSRVFEDSVMPWMLYGINGTRAVIYHKSSRTMLQAIKSLSPDRFDGKVTLRVTKSRAPKKSIYEADSGWRLPMKRKPFPCLIVPYWRLPSSRKGEILLDIDCGASLTKVDTVIQRIVSDDPALTENPVFDIWCEKSGVGLVRGKFEDFGK